MGRRKEYPEGTSSYKISNLLCLVLCSNDLQDFWRQVKLSAKELTFIDLQLTTKKKKNRHFQNCIKPEEGV